MYKMWIYHDEVMNSGEDNVQKYNDSHNRYNNSINSCKNQTNKNFEDKKKSRAYMSTIIVVIIWKCTPQWQRLMTKKSLGKWFFMWLKTQITCICFLLECATQYIQAWIKSGVSKFHCSVMIHSTSDGKLFHVLINVQVTCVMIFYSVAEHAWFATYRYYHMQCLWIWWIDAALSYIEAAVGCHLLS